MVHYFPLYSERAQHVAPADLYQRYGSQIPSVSSYTYGGQVWFKPKADLAAITLVFASAVVHVNGYLPTQPVGPNDPVYTLNNPAWPAINVFGPDGNQVASTHISGTSPDGLGNPVGTPAQFVPASIALHSFVAQNQTWHYKIFMEGVEPFVSSTQEEWFDPRQYRSPDLQQFLVPRD